MKLSPLFVTLLISAFVLTAHAATKKTTPPKAVPVKKEEPKDDSYPLYGEVVKVSATALVIKGAEGKPDRSFAFTENSKIVAGEKSARLSDIKVGNKVGGLVRKAGKGDDLLLKVNVDVKQGNEVDEVADKTRTEPKKPASTTTAKKKKAA